PSSTGAGTTSARAAGRRSSIAATSPGSTGATTAMPAPRPSRRRRSARRPDDRPTRTSRRIGGFTMAGGAGNSGRPPAGDRRRRARDADAGAWGPAPLGPTIVDGAVGLSVYAPKASGLDVLLFDAADDPLPGRVISLDRATHLTSGYWHVEIEGIG